MRCTNISKQARSVIHGVKGAIGKLSSQWDTGSGKLSDIHDPGFGEVDTLVKVLSLNITASFTQMSSFIRNHVIYVPKFLMKLERKY